MDTVSREQAEAILADIRTSYASPREAGPNLRDNDHEELDPGCWSIDWEEGPEGWVFKVSEWYARYPGVLLEPINHVILGIYPA